MVISSSQIRSRASLCAVPGSGASNASAQSLALSQMSDQGVLEVLAPQHRHQAEAVFVVGGLDQVVDDPGHLLAFGGDRGVVPPLAPGRLDRKSVV